MKGCGLCHQMTGVAAIRPGMLPYRSDHQRHGARHPARARPAVHPRPLASVVAGRMAPASAEGEGGHPHAVDGPHAGRGEEHRRVRPANSARSGHPSRRPSAPCRPRPQGHLRRGCDPRAAQDLLALPRRARLRTRRRRARQLRRLRVQGQRPEPQRLPRDLCGISRRHGTADERVHAHGRRDAVHRRRHAGTPEGRGGRGGRDSRDAAGLPALPPEDVQLVDTWIAQGRQR